MFALKTSQQVLQFTPRVPSQTAWIKSYACRTPRLASFNLLLETPTTKTKNISRKFRVILLFVIHVAEQVIWYIKQDYKQLQSCWRRKREIKQGPQPSMMHVNSTTGEITQLKTIGAALRSKLKGAVTCKDKTRMLDAINTNILCNCRLFNFLFLTTLVVNLTGNIWRNGPVCSKKEIAAKRNKRGISSFSQLIWTIN